MVKLGVPGETVKSASPVNASSAQAASTVTTVDGQPSIVLGDTLDRAWRRTGVALDRTGFTVEDRDRSKGLYFVRYVTPSKTTDKETGFFAKLFGSKASAVPLTRYRIVVTEKGETIVVRVMNNDGQPEVSDNAERILKLLANELR